MTTSVTGVGLLPSVDALVACQVGTLAKPLSAFATSAGLLSRVAAQVAGQVPHLAEAFATLGTVVRPEATVGQQMANKARTSHKSFVALRTGMGLLTCVHLLVADQLGTLGKTAAADLAGERSFAGVDSPVGQQVLASSEGLATVTAHIGLALLARGKAARVF